MESGVLLSYVKQFVLIFIRVSAIFTFSPVFGRKNAPAILKIGFSIVLSYILLSVYPPQQAEESMTIEVYSYTLACLKELLVGLVIGYVTVLFFSIAYTAGQLIDIQIGFGMAQLFDPQAGSQVTINSSLLNITLLLCIFLTNGHHSLIRILSNTFAVLPPGDFSINLGVISVLLTVFVSTFVMGVQVAMPIIAATFLAEVCLGILMRSVPQMNMFVIGIPLKLIVGLILLVMISPVFVQVTSPLFEGMFNNINNMMEGLAA